MQTANLPVSSAYMVNSPGHSQPYLCEHLRTEGQQQRSRVTGEGLGEGLGSQLGLAAFRNSSVPVKFAPEGVYFTVR